MKKFTQPEINVMAFSTEESIMNGIMLASTNVEKPANLTLVKHTITDDVNAEYKQWQDWI